MSISVCSSMCPMCSEPVTFGGGITIENTGPGRIRIRLEQLFLDPVFRPARLYLLRFVCFGYLSSH